MALPISFLQRENRLKKLTQWASIFAVFYIFMNIVTCILINLARSMDVRKASCGIMETADTLPIEFLPHGKKFNNTKNLKRVAMFQDY